MAKKKTKKKNVFSSCCTCFSISPIECDEFTCPSFSKEGTDFEYIVENWAIKKAPKKLLDQVVAPSKKIQEVDKTEKDFSGYVVKKVPPEMSIGPIIILEDDSIGQRSCCDMCAPSKLAAPICTTDQVRYPPSKRPGVGRTYQVETSQVLDCDTIKELLKPHTTLYQDDAQKKVSVDIHKVDGEEDMSKSGKVIPPDIKQAIEALKVAKPLHYTSELPSRNRKNLIRSPSFTSCEKDTLCNFSDEMETEKALKTSSRAKMCHILPDKIDASSSTSDFPDNSGCNENISSDLQTTDKTETTESLQGQSLKWKIIINKHKDSIIFNTE